MRMIHIDPNSSSSFALRGSSGCGKVTSQADPPSSSFYDLPAVVGDIYRQRGITTLYDWQHDILTRSDVATGRSLVYSLPTSGGKSLVAEILLMRAVLKRRKMACFVLPYVAVAEEKLISLRQFAEKLGFGADGYYSDVGRFPVPREPGVLVCTIEKGNSLLNFFIENGRCAELGTIVVDELHIIGDGRRGANLELLLTKWLTVCGGSQIIGMSATIPNLQSIALWLGASCYINNFRPVPLVEHIVADNTDSVDGSVVRVLPCKHDLDILLFLVFECIPHASVLIFCSTRQQCVEVARLVASRVDRRENDVRQKRGCNAALEELVALDHCEPTLAETIPMGVAYHHGGLLAEERDVVERAFRKRCVTVLSCTSTLAAGVNLPAQRVIIRTPYVGRELLSKSMYLQMCGRAGRAGLDPHGESFLLLNSRDRHVGHLLTSKPLEPVASQIMHIGGIQGFARIILDAVVSRICETAASVATFSGAFLYTTTTGTLDHSAALDMLKKQNLIEIDDANSKIFATQLGIASVRACFSIEDARFVHTELSHLQRNGIILSDELHVCYVLTPVQDIVSCNWVLLQQFISRFNPTRQRIAELIGVDESAVDQLSSGRAEHTFDRQIIFTLRRFYTSLMLCDVLHEVPLGEIETRYRVNRGQVQVLMKSAATYSASICNFCSILEWHNLAGLLESFVKRLGFGVRPDLVPLMELTGMTPSRARALWNAGFRTPKSIVDVEPEALKATVKLKNPGSRSAKYFSSKSAAAVVREAHRVVFTQITHKRNEIIELSIGISEKSFPSSASRP